MKTYKSFIAKLGKNTLPKGASVSSDALTLIDELAQRLENRLHDSV